MPKQNPLENESWFKSRWRPAMAWQYLVVCLFDFIGGPVMNAVLSYLTDNHYHDWNPMTLRGGGLYHLAMAAILGIAAWTRGVERQIVMKNGGSSYDDDDDDDYRPRRRYHRDRNRDDDDHESDDSNDYRHKGEDK